MASRPRGSARPRVTRVFVRLAVVVGLAGILLLAGSGAAEAHPLGNFTINLYDGLIVRTDGIDVDYVVDMAEIPAFEERQTIDVNGDGTLDPTETAAYVDQTCGRPRTGSPSRSLGARSRCVPRAPARSRSLQAPAVCRRCASSARCTARRSSARASRSPIATRNFAGRIGWHEVTVVGDRHRGARQRRAGTKLERASHVVSRRTSCSRRSINERPRSGGRPDVGSRPRRRPTSSTAPITRGFGDMFTTAFACLVTTGGSSPLLWSLALATAFAIGGLHALGPGHGKTLMAAYLVGIDVRPRQVVAVGAAVSVMHTASVVALGVTVLAAGQAFTPEVAYRWTTIASGALVAILGGYLLITRLASARHARAHAHGHDHDHTHEPRPVGSVSRRSPCRAASSPRPRR